MPYSTLNLFLEILQFASNFIFIFFASIFLCFNYKTDDYSYLGIHYAKVVVFFIIMCVLIFFDITKALITCYYNEKGIAVMDRSLITKNYLNKKFKFDILSLIPVLFNRVTFVNFPLIIQILEFFVFFKIYNLIDFIKKYNQTFVMKSRNENL